MKLQDAYYDIVRDTVDMIRNRISDPGFLNQYERMDPIAFAKSVFTVRLNLGRQLGTSTTISRLANENDVIISRSTHDVDTMKQRLAQWHALGQAEVKTPSTGLSQSPDSNGYRTVWIDTPTYFQEGQVQRIYEIYAPMKRDQKEPTLFELLGE